MIIDKILMLVAATILLLFTLFHGCGGQFKESKDNGQYKCIEIDVDLVYPDNVACGVVV